MYLFRYTFISITFFFSPTFEASQATKELIKNNIAKVQEDIEKARKELEAEQKVGSVAEKYWDKVEKARLHFSEELESLFPNIDLSKKQLSVTTEDLDLFVLHAYAHVLYYQKELAKMETVMQEKLYAAVEAAKRGGGDVLTNAQICEALEQEKRRLSLCFQQQVSYQLTTHRFKSSYPIIQFRRNGFVKLVYCYLLRT